MLQSISFSVYLALGAGVFSRIEGWNISDGIYWADYTLLTVGLGSDFPLTTTLAKILLLPYAVVGITMVGLIVSSVRGLVLERAKAKVVRRYLGKERDKWHAELKARRSGRDATTSRNSRSHLGSLGSRLFDLVQSKTKKETNELLFQLYEHAITESKRSMPWHKTEYEVMRFIEASADSAEMYTGLWVSLLILAFVWIGGSLVFWSLQKTTEWAYLDSIFFTYTTLLTIGYGDYYPTSSAAKPFFVVWTLIAVPAMTVLISNIGDSVIKWVKDATMWFGKWTVDVPGVYASNDHGKRAEVRGKAKMVLRHALPTPTESHDCRTAEVDQTDSISETKKNLINSESSNHRRDAEAESLGRNVDQSDRSKITPYNDLSTKIANEIGALLADFGENPPLKYNWKKWELWLHLLGKAEADGAADDIREMNAMDLGIGDVGDSQAVVKNDAKSERQRSPGRDLHDGEVGKGATYGRNDNEDWSWTWTWLGDDGPLFSRLTETEWILEKLCARLKEVLGNEISESRNSRKFSTSTTLPNL